MLVLSRKSRESVVVGGNDAHRLLKVTVLEISPGRVKLGFDVDADVPIHRSEVWERIRAEGRPERLTQGPAQDENVIQS